MTMPQLPSEWEPTRATLQAYGRALTAFPRAAGVANDRWTHVAMTIDSSGLRSAAVPLSDGSELITRMDLVTHEIVLEAASDVERISLLNGPSPSSIGDAVLAFAANHGTTIDVDADRFSGRETLEYRAEHAAAFLEAATFVADAFRTMNRSIDGEVTGPHVWPHGFDIATEWFSPVKVPYGDDEASAQIAIGWYPAAGGYFYANPWPFDESWSATPVYEGSTWHLEDWQGAVLPADLADKVSIVAFGKAVHDLAAPSLSAGRTRQGE